MHSQPPKSPLSGGLSDMATITGFTGIIEIDGVYYVVEDGQAYYFDDTDNED